MRRLIKWILIILLVLLVVVAILGLLNREKITRLMAVNSLFTEEKIVSNFSNMNTMFLSADVARGDLPTSELQYGADAPLPDGFNQWLTDRSVTSILVMKNGQILHENYLQGTGPEDLRISWSVAKSYLSALLGVLISEGAINSIDDPVVEYAPELIGSAYEATTIKNVLQMSSGVTFNEDYLDFHSDINKMGRTLALGGKMDEFAASLSESFTAPGTTWQYVSIDTHVLGMVIRGATGRSIPDLLSEKIIAPLGYEYAPYYVTDGVGVSFVLGGLNITTRDYARFGQMIEQNGRYGGNQVVPAGWVLVSTKGSANTLPGETQYGYQWWSPADASPGEFFARGVYGQYIYIDQARDTVIVATQADRQFREEGVNDQNIAMFRAITAGLP